MPISKAISIREEVESLGNSLAKTNRRAKSIVDGLETNYGAWDNDRFSDVEKEFLEFQAFCNTLAQSFDKLPLPHVSYAPYKGVVDDFRSKTRRARAHFKGVPLPEEVVLLGYSEWSEKIRGQMICMGATGELYFTEQWHLRGVAVPSEYIKREYIKKTELIQVFTIPKRISEVVHVRAGIDLIPLSLPLPARVEERWPWARLQEAVANSLEAWAQSLKNKSVAVGR